MKKDLAVAKTNTVEEATQQCCAILLPKAIKVLDDMLDVKSDVKYTRLHLEVVKTVLGVAGLTKQASGNAKDPGKMTAEEILKHLDDNARNAKLINAKPLNVLD